jgi:integrase
MGRTLNRLSEMRVRKLKTKGMYADGGNLYLACTVGDDGNVRKSWIFRYQLPGKKARDMGMGPLHTIGLAEARERAALHRKLVLDGVDPLEQKKAQQAAAAATTAKMVTFEQAAKSYMQMHQAAWTPIHARDWRASLENLAYPVIGKLDVAAIDTALVMKVLEPHWTERRETASRVRGRIENILGWATTSGFRTGDNPSRWKGHLENLLSKKNKLEPKKHMAALEIDEMPGFMSDLRKQKSMAGLALEFVMLTVVRSADVRAVRWSDIDTKGKCWTVRAFSKTGKSLKIPLSSAALDVLKKAGEFTSDGFIFTDNGAMLNKNLMLNVLQRMGVQKTMTVHGGRSAFRSWAQERTNFPREVCEMALGHTIGSEVERAYARSDLFAKRKIVMDGWAAFLAKPTAETGKVIPLHQNASAERP